MLLNILNTLRALMKKSIALTLAVALLAGLTGFIDNLSAPQRYPEVAKQNIVGLGAWNRSQDVTTDGENYYFSARTGLIKTLPDGVTETAMNLNAIPQALRENYGSAHIGGISWYNGKIYAAIEDSKVWQYPIVALFDGDTLAYTGEYHILDASLQKNGLPWIAVDAERGLIYCAQRDNAPALIAYSLETFELVKTVPLSEPVHKIQGAEVYGGVLYAATNNDTQAVYAVDVLTGETRKLFDRNLTQGSEGEGLTVLPTADGALIHTLDLGPLFINAYFRHYALPDVS